MRYLGQDEKGKTRALWEEAFPEDSKPFDDYYYREKVRDNRILVKEEEGEIISMVHLNPYRIRVRDRQYTLAYIVGVATRKDRRHRGHMGDLLKKMLRDMNADREPFTFLMPAAEAIYRPFGFRFVWDRPALEWKEEVWESLEKTEAGLTEQEGPDRDRRIRELACWQQAFLEKNWEVHSVRDEAYVRRTMLELISENGSWTVLREKDTGRIRGMESWWGWNGRERRFLYGEGDQVRPAGIPKPVIMARITCLEEFVRTISLKEDSREEELRQQIRIRDELIPENDGAFLWILDKNGSRMERTDAEGDCPSIGIEELAEWLMGYKIPEGLPVWADRIRPLRGIFLDEIV